ncbi:MAG TPA: SelB C-terminal domain-containing protein [Mycobacteriales bacterium]|nr:SelB C-terminal domain-containing protein [Mycobacteriales bacterium]
MHVVATAGHVDHGKSTLVRALTGMEPDRWEAERRRGLTIDLGFCWTSLPGRGDVAFVDVPGHERFVPNMLAGVGPVPAVLFVVAADEGWMPQSEEHLAALAAFGVRHGVLAVTRCDLADPELATEEALERIRATPLGDVPAVAVSAPTGAGLAELRTALAALAGRLPAPDPDADVRLWVDRCFTIRGAGTVVTGTLPAGTVRTGDRLELGSASARQTGLAGARQTGSGGPTVTVRGVQALGRTVDEASGVARVALNLRGVSTAELRRGDALLTPGAFRATTVVDVRLDAGPNTGPNTGPDGGHSGRLAERRAGQLVLHVGSAAVGVRVRPLGADTARLTLATPLPLRVGDRALLRDPGSHRAPAGVLTLDVAPPPLSRRGDAARRAAVLDALDGRPDPLGEVARRGLVRVADLRAWGHGVPADLPVLDGQWYLHAERAAALRARLLDLVAAHRQQDPLQPGPPVDAAARALGLASPRLLAAVLPPALTTRAGRVVPADGGGSRLPDRLAGAVATLAAELAAAPYAAPDAARLAALGLGPRELAAAARAGWLLLLGDGVVLLPGADERAVAILGGLPQPFTVADARQALGTTRRVAVPLLEHLDARRRTQKLPDGRRTLR